jgi:NADPH:quinone reductase
MNADTMRFIDISQPGGAEVLQIAKTAIPQPGPGQVLIKVHAAGLNRLDILQRNGFYPPPPGSSEILGVEVAGEIVNITDGCQGVSIGDKVCALLPGGGYAEYVVADAVTCLPVPEGLNMIQAAALPEAMFTVWNNVFNIAELKPGETFLVHGGASGIGTAAIQLAKAFGAKVYTTVRNEKKADFCRSLGADIAINYNTQDFVKVCLDDTQGKGMNVILDMIGGDYLGKNIKLAASGGRIVMIAVIKGHKFEANLLTIMQKGIILTGSTLRAKSPEFKQAIATELLNKVWPLIVSGVIRPIIHQVFPLEQAGNAHRLMESNEHCGKIVLELN